MNKHILFLTILASLFIAPAYASDEAIKPNDKVATPLCSISIYKEDTPLLVGTKFKLKNGQFLVSNCSDASMSFNWWELSRELAAAWDVDDNSNPPIPPSTKE